MTPPEIPDVQGVDVPERITRAILAAKAQWDREHPDRPNSFTLGRAIAAARAQWRKEKPAKVNGRDVLFDAIVKACGGDLSSLTPSYSAQVAKAKKEILLASPNVTADEVTRRATRYRAKYRDAACTPLALAKHWPEFPLPQTRPSLYDEPVGWHDSLRALAEANRWDRATVQLMLQSQWSELSHTIRQEILNARQERLSAP